MQQESLENVLKGKSYFANIDFRTQVTDVDDFTVTPKRDLVMNGAEWNTMRADMGTYFELAFPKKNAKLGDQTDVQFVIPESIDNASMINKDFFIRSYSTSPFTIYNINLDSITTEDISFRQTAAMNFGDIIKFDNQYYRLELLGVDKVVTLKLISQDSAEFILMQHYKQREDVITIDQMKDMLVGNKLVKWAEDKDGNFNIILGRANVETFDPANKVILNGVNERSGISREHCRIIYRPFDDKFYIYDAGSKNGTYVRAKTQPVEDNELIRGQAELKNGSILTLGNASMPVYFKYEVKINPNGEISLFPITK